MVKWAHPPLSFVLFLSSGYWKVSHRTKKGKQSVKKQYTYTTVLLYSVGIITMHYFYNVTNLVVIDSRE